MTAARIKGPIRRYSHFCEKPFDVCTKSFRLHYLAPFKTEAQLIRSREQKKTLDNILGQYQAGCDRLTREEVTRLVDTGRFEKWGYTADAGSVRYEDAISGIQTVKIRLLLSDSRMPVTV